MKRNEPTKSFTFKGMTDSRALLVTGVAAWLICAAAALFITGATRMTAPAWTLSLATSLALADAIIIGISLIGSRLILRDLWSKRTGLVLAGMASVICIGISINVAGWCPNGDLWNPQLGFDSTDTGRTWLMTTAIYSGSPLPYTDKTFFPTLICWLWRAFGGGILAPLCLGAVCMILSAPLTALISRVLLPELNPRKVTFWSVVLFALVPSMEWYASLPMKEGIIILGFALMSYSLACAWRGRLSLKMILASALGALILLWLKYLLCVFIVLGAALAAVRVFSARRKGLKGSLNAPLCVILMAAAAIAGGHSFSRSSIDQRTLVYHYDETELRQDSIMDNLMLWAPSYSGYRKILGGYYVNSTASRIARLPFTASAQYFPPFPWNFTRDTVIGRFVPWAHLPLWYLVGGLILAYYIFCAFSRRRRGNLALWSLWLALCWFGIAYVSAGSVSRYWLPLVPALIPPGLQVAACVRSCAISRKAISIYSITYLVLLAAALTAANICLYQ